MSLFEIPKWEETNSAAAEALNCYLFKLDSAKGKKKNTSRQVSLVDTETSLNKKKKKGKNGMLKKLVNLKTDSPKEDFINDTPYQSSTKNTTAKNVKGNKIHNISTGNKIQNIKQNCSAAPVSGHIKKRKKKNCFQKMTNEDSVTSNENHSVSFKEVKEKLKYSERLEPNTAKGAPKKRKRLHSESAVPLLKTTGLSSEEWTRPLKKLKNEIKATITDISTDTIEPQKSPYNILKLKEIFAKTPPSSLSKKNKAVTTLRERMMQKLQASRFRYLNEQLYTSEPKEAQELFRSDPEAFQAYHEGYQQQVERWPMNPLDVIIKSLKKKPSDLVIADFGCGDAQLARALPNRVHSFDLVAMSDEVIACNMAHTPLSNASVDVVVFCLSLMGTSLKDFLTEANRVLKEGGLMKIAEVESRFENVEELISKLQKYGFACTWKDLSHNLFYFLDFKKERNINKKMKKKLPELTLKPCLYKKR